MMSTDGYDGADDFAKSVDLGFQVIRDRMKAGGPGWKSSLPEEPNRTGETTMPLMPPAYRCRCPDPTCSGWRQVVSLGGGHVTRERALQLLENDPRPKDDGDGNAARLTQGETTDTSPASQGNQ